MASADETETSVHLSQQVFLRHQALCIHQLHYASLHFSLFHHFSHPVSLYLLNVKKSALGQTFSTSWAQPEGCAKSIDYCLWSRGRVPPRTLPIIQ